MARQSNIFSRLKEYGVQPPPEAFIRLCNQLDAEKETTGADQLSDRLHSLQDLEIQPPASLQKSVFDAIAAQPSLSFLQNIPVPPPAGAFEQIKRQPPVHKTRRKYGASIKKTLTLYPFRSAAASLALLLAAWGVYRLTVVSPQRQMPAASVWQAPPKPINRNPADPDSAVNEQPILNYQAYDHPGTENYFKNDGFKTSGNFFSLVDNDFIVTFASFTEDDLPAFLTKEENDQLFIRLDQYSAFAISENMVAMLKNLYRKKPNGSLSRKAIKERKKLDQWKKADEKRFDKATGNNPLDPIDLAEFIFK